MSFMKYIESKIRPNIIIDTSLYQEQLKADVASLLLKPDDKLIEARKNIIDITEMTHILSKISYPLMNELCMSLRTGDVKKISHAHMVFRRWSEYCNYDKNLIDKIETAIFQYQIKLYGNEFGPNDADRVVKSSLTESFAILNKMSQNLNLMISGIPTWGNHQIIIEAIAPEKDWIINEAKVKIGNMFTVDFIYENTPLGFKIKNINETEEIPVSLKSDFQILLNKLQKNPKYDKISTLYMNRPLSERRVFEIIKRDLSLGIKSVLPQHIILSTSPLTEGTDVWKVKIEEKYLYEYLNEGSIKQYQIMEEAPLRWIERINVEK